jgi:hypothetical protein
MRGLGAFLFIIGFFFCLTVVLSGLGVLMMIVGFCLMVAGGGRRKVVIHNVVNVNSPPTTPYKAPLFSFGKKTPRLEPQIEQAPRFALAGPSDTPNLRTINPDQYDKVKWRALVEYDPDISRVAAALAPYGQKYTDQLATAYLALNDKDYLPLIVQKILATARDDLRQRSESR